MSGAEPPAARPALDRPRLAIVGATGTGKTALAVDLARAAPGRYELVSVDAMAVYRDLDLGTAKPTAAERTAAPWHLIDAVDPGCQFSVADFQALARSAVAGIEARGHTVVLVGGTGLYHRAVLDALAIPGRFPEVAARLEREADGPDGLSDLFARLTLLDPLAATRVEPTNRRRIVRALEVTIGTGRRFSSFGPGLREYPPTSATIIGLTMDRAELDRRLSERFDAQLAAGLLEEVRALASRPQGLSRTARQAIGYRELLAHLEESLPFEKARADALARLRALARRQESWFRRDPRVIWFDAGSDDLFGSVSRLVAERLGAAAARH